MIRERKRERAGKAVFLTAASLCVIAVVAVFAFLIYRSIPAFSKLGFFSFVLGDDWSPDRTDTYAAPLSGTYGILTMIAGTLLASTGALLFGGVIGYFTAVFIAFYASERLNRIFTFMIRLLAAIPSVVYGFFGISFLLPLLSYIAPNNGSGLLATALILGIMILPTVVSLSITSMKSVSRAYYDGSAALGADHSETVFRVMIPAARSGIVASLVLGVGRALGETMAVVMVAGNAPAYPSGLFSSFRVLTANIVMEMGYAGEVQEGALIATGTVLLVFILLVNLLFASLLGNEKRKKKRGGKGMLGALLRDLHSRFYFLENRIGVFHIGRWAAYASALVTGGALMLLVGFILIKGMPYLVTHPTLIFGKYEFGSHRITVFPAIVTTLYALAISLVTAIPIGIMTAVYLNEYSRKRSRIVRVIRSAVDILSGVPSVVYGLFGMITFVPLFGGTSSIMAGSLTVSIMLLPIIVRSVEESLRAVPEGMREGSMALGAGKLRTVIRIVLPSSFSGILSASLLSMGRVISESAPFLYTMGSVISALPRGVLDSGATLSVALYQLSGEGWYISEAYATAVVLIFIVLLLNLMLNFVSSKLAYKIKGK